jgi:hypothetical protein
MLEISATLRIRGKEENERKLMNFQIYWSFYSLREKKSHFLLFFWQKQELTRNRRWSLLERTKLGALIK